jgi:hypothetical protein
MKRFTHRLVIETAENGFLVYVNQDFSAGAIRPLPYVFESMENLLNFVSENFSEEKAVDNYFSTTYRPMK